MSSKRNGASRAALEGGEGGDDMDAGGSATAAIAVTVATVAIGRAATGT
jgi:hypothetical protein